MLNQPFPMQKISSFCVFQVLFLHYLQSPGGAGNASGRKSSQTYSIQHKKEQKKISWFIERKNILLNFSFFMTLKTHILPIAKTRQLEEGIFMSFKLLLFYLLLYITLQSQSEASCFRHGTNKKQNAYSCLKGLITL